MIILEAEAVKPLLEAEFYSEIIGFAKGSENGNFSGKIRLLPVRTLGNTGFIPAFTAEKAVVSGNDTIRIIDRPTIGVTSSTFEGKTYSALINESVTGQVI